MAKALKTAAVVVGVAAIAITLAPVLGPGSAAVAGSVASSLGFSSAAALAATLSAASAAASLASAALTKKPSNSVTASGNPENFTADKNAGVSYVVGRTSVSGWLIHRQTYDVAALATTNNAFQTLFAVWGGGGPYQQLEAFKIDSNTIDFLADPVAATAPVEASGTFHGNLFLQAQLGQTPEGNALKALDVNPYPAGWSAQSKLSGYAAFALTLRWDPEGKKFPSGVPQPTAVLKGSLVYDPRADSTFPGGSGACRPLNEATYVYSGNPALHALTWALGRWQNGKRILGIGMTLAAIDVPAYVQAANVADANEWTIGGVVYSTDGKLDVLKKMLAACSGQPLQLGGMLSCEVDTPRVSLATITDDQIIGDATVVATPTISERINGVIPSCRLEDHDWSIVPCAKVQVDAYVTTDGKTRTKAITYELVQDADQAAELATYAICNAREFGPIVTPLKLRWIGYRPGDCLTIQSANLGMDSQTVVIRNRHLEPASGAVTLTMRSETPEKHAFSLGQTTTPPPTPSLQVIDRGDLPTPGIDASWPSVSDPDPINHPKPDDGAVDTRNPGAPFGPSTVGATRDAIVNALSALAATETEIAALTATYGDTATAAAARDAALAAKAVTEAARDTSVAAAAASSGSASASSGSADTATTQAGAAGSSAAAAHASEVAAEGFSNTSSTGAAVATSQAAVASSQAAAAHSSAILSASIGPGVLNPNPNFADWLDPTTGPTYWYEWDYSGGAPQRVSGLDGIPYSCKFSAAANANCGEHQVLNIAAGKYVVEVTADLTAGTFDGAGVLVTWNHVEGGAATNIGSQALSFLTATDTAGYSGNGGFRRTWTMSIDTGVNGSINQFVLYAMANWNGFPTARSAKDITFRSVRIRPASAPEIAVSGKASIEQVNEVAISAESARAATQLTLQAKIDGNAATAHSETVVAATAAASAAASVSILSVTVSGLSATVGSHSGVLATLDGRTQAYLQLSAVAGTSHAEIDMLASDGSTGGYSALVFKAGKFLFEGDAVFDGTVSMRKFDISTMASDGGEGSDGSLYSTTSGGTYVNVSGWGIDVPNVRTTGNAYGSIYIDVYDINVFQIQPPAPAAGAGDSFAFFQATTANGTQVRSRTFKVMTGGGSFRIKLPADAGDGTVNVKLWLYQGSSTGDYVSERVACQLIYAGARWAFV